MVVAAGSQRASAFVPIPPGRAPQFAGYGVDRAAGTAARCETHGACTYHSSRPLSAEVDRAGSDGGCNPLGRLTRGLLSIHNEHRRGAAEAAPRAVPASADGSLPLHVCGAPGATPPRYPVTIRRFVAHGLATTGRLALLGRRYRYVSRVGAGSFSQV
jgi:hypothetical protein